MSVAETIRDKLTERFAPTRLDIVDESHRHAGHAGARPEGETHFAVTITSATFGGLGRVARQRLVYEALKEELAARIRPMIDIYRVAAHGYVDDVIDPRDTRPLLAHYLRLTESKRVDRPHRKREISPV